MQIKELKNILRKDVPIYYRRLYSGTAVVEMLGKTHDVDIDFSIETKPTGAKDVIINIAKSLDFPIIPLTQELKKLIDRLDFEFKLPT
jgi:hypothetical protein